MRFHAALRVAVLPLLFPLGACATAAPAARAEEPASPPAPLTDAAVTEAVESGRSHGIGGLRDDGAGASNDKKQKLHRKRTPRKKPSATGQPLGDRTVVRAVDGDTAELEDGERVRILLINTPERGEPFFDEATEVARKFAEGKQARITPTPGARDKYSRLLGDLQIGESTWAEQLIESGFAHLYVIPPADPATIERMLAAQARARAAKRGLWSLDVYAHDFHLTSFHADAPGDDRQNLNGEYVRIACIAEGPRSLAGYKLSNDRGELMELPDVTLPVGWTLTVHTGAGDNAVDPAHPMTVYVGRTEPMWSNRADVASLLDPKGAVVSFMKYPKQRAPRRKAD